MGYAIGEIYHVFNKSIAGYKIFNNDLEFARMKETLKYYKCKKPHFRFSYHKQNADLHRPIQHSTINSANLVQIVAYCIMPTHLHLVLKNLIDNGISSFISNALNSYTRYFNIKHGRKGPLWESKTKKVLVSTDEQLIHLTRYVHLNPVTACLVEKPDQWIASSYNEYLSTTDDNVCEFRSLIGFVPASYKKFVEDQISYQRELAKIKELCLD